jgi:DNA polymerase I-like protein with 3'-5' exonuclease and polymerase domains
MIRLRRLPPFDFRVVDRENFDEFLRQYERATDMAFDIETTGLEWWNPDLVINCIQFSLIPGENWVLPVAKARILSDVHIGVLLRELAKLSHKKKIVAGQNAKFDNNWLQRRYGARFHLTFDTMLAHHLADENSPHGLKELSRVFLNAPDYDLSLKEKKGNVDPMKLFEYGARDTAYTLQLVPILMKMLKDEDQWLLYNRLTMRAARAMERIEQRGLWLNVEKLNEAGENERRLMDESLARLNKMAGEEINWNAPDQVAAILYDKLSLRARVKTPKGKPSTSEAAIIDIDHPIAKELVEYRKHAKFLSTYIDGWRSMMVGNKLYIGYKLHGTVTGRYASRLHSIPRDGTIRNLVEAPPGWAMVAADYSQVELRLAAHHSGDTQMLTAQRVSGIENPTKEERKKAKPVNFGFLYGMWWKKFREYAKLNYGVEFTDAEAQEARTIFFELYSDLPKWHNKQRALARMDGFVRNIFGRKRRLPAVYSNNTYLRQEAERQGINSPIQGGAGDLKGAAMVELDESFDDDVLQVVGEHHDAILMWVKNEHLHSTLPRVKSIMEHPKLLDELGIVFRVPIVVDIETGPWGAGTKWEPPQ